jgi:hypothetical protein
MKKILLTLVIFQLCLFVNAQTIPTKHEDHKTIFKDNGEIYFMFNVSKKSDLDFVSRIVSVDKIVDGVVFAYANIEEFENFLNHNFEYTILKKPHEGCSFKMYDVISKKNKAWDSYPTYSAYESMMYQFEIDYPQLCRIDTIGILSSGKKLLVARITDKPDIEENEPEFLYTSSMHGDEICGYVLMLRLIDYLLSNYDTDPIATNIVNNVEIWINPLANPDGTYAGGNDSVHDATRNNANYIDLNRNYPDPEDGPHPDGNIWQPETQFFMDFADSNNFDMAANFHGGAEVVNYPWDTWSQLAADDNWWIYVSSQYADTAQNNSPSTYFDGFNDGISNGYAWYSISGGRQDYMNYFKHCREVTIEISNQKILFENQLLSHWNYNYKSLINYMEQSLFGLRGILSDSITNVPIKGKIFINGHDMDSSHVYSSLPVGDYHRYLFAGNYNVTYSSPGYKSKTINGINITNDSTTVLDVQLVPNGTGIYQKTDDEIVNIYPNPAKNIFFIEIEKPVGKIFNVELIDTDGRMIYIDHFISYSNTNLSIDVSDFNSGIYFLRLFDNENVYCKKIIIHK